MAETISTGRQTRRARMNPLTLSSGRESRGSAPLVRVASRKPRGIHVGSRLDQHLDDRLVPGTGGGVERKDSVEDRIDGLSMREGVLNESCAPDRRRSATSRAPRGVACSLARSSGARARSIVGCHRLGVKSREQLSLVISLRGPEYVRTLCWWSRARTVFPCRPARYRNEGSGASVCIGRVFGDVPTLPLAAALCKLRST